MDYNDFGALQESEDPTAEFVQAPPVPPAVALKHPINVALDNQPLSDVLLPVALSPALPLHPGSQGVAQYYMLEDGVTGVMALGSFSESVVGYKAFLAGFLTGLQGLKASGAQKLIIDVVGVFLLSCLPVY